MNLEQAILPSPSMLVSLALQVKMVYGHSIAYTYSTKYKVPHGASVAISLPYIMWYNLPAYEERLAKF